MSAGLFCLAVLKSYRMMKRVFLFQHSQAEVFHMTNRFLDLVYHFGDEASKDHFLKIVRAYEVLSMESPVRMPVRAGLMK